MYLNLAVTSLSVEVPSEKCWIDYTRLSNLNPIFRTIAGPCERQGVIIAANLESSRWRSLFGNNKVTAAVIDRVLHHDRLVQFRGKSYRVRHSLMQEG